MDGMTAESFNKIASHSPRIDNTSMGQARRLADTVWNADNPLMRPQVDKSTGVSQAVPALLLLLGLYPETLIEPWTLEA